MIIPKRYRNTEFATQVEITTPVEISDPIEGYEIDHRSIVVDTERSHMNFNSMQVNPPMNPSVNPPVNQSANPPEANVPVVDQA